MPRSLWLWQEKQDTKSVLKTDLLWRFLVADLQKLSYLTLLWTALALNFTGFLSCRAYKNFYIIDTYHDQIDATQWQNGCWLSGKKICHIFFQVYWAVGLFILNTMPCPSTLSQNVLGQSSLFWARQKTALYLVPLKKMLCQPKNWI